VIRFFVINYGLNDHFMNQHAVLYNKIGVGYNTTRHADPQITERLFELLGAKTDGIYLDIGCGTGNYTIALADLGLSFYGVEPSETMLQIAKGKNKDVNWLLGNAEQIPLGNEIFDGAIATLTIHHWRDLQKAFGEIYRVLKPGCRLVIFTAGPEQMKCYWLNHYFPKMMGASIAQMPSFTMIKNAAAQVGFKTTATEKYFIDDDLKDLFLYSGKNRPEMYLDEQVRKGISSFAALALKDEVTNGLSELAEDMESGHFQSVKNKFSDVQGDYLFIIARKPL